MITHAPCAQRRPEVTGSGAGDPRHAGRRDGSSPTIDRASDAIPDLPGALDRRPFARIERTPFKTSRLLEFCSQRELIAQTGQAVGTWSLVILKELVDNSLDECEEAGVAPLIAIDVSTADRTLTISDNGRGLRPEVVADLLDFGSRTSSKEAYCSPTRGQQGNALSTILPMPFVLAKAGEEPGSITIEACGIAHEIKVRLDPIRQEPAVSHRQSPSVVKTGTRIAVRLPVSACSILDDAEPYFLQVVAAYTFLNPHLTIEAAWDGDVFQRAAFNLAWPKWRPSDPTCPHWYNQARLERLIGAHVVNGRERTVREFIAEFRGLSGSAKQKAVLDKIGLVRAPLSSLCTTAGFATDNIAALLAAMQAITKPMKPNHLGIIGKDHLAQYFEAAGAEMETFNYSREVGLTNGLPWVVEVGFAWCPDDEDQQLITGINWSPAIANPFRSLGTWGQSLDAILAEQRAGRDEPVTIVLHLACPRVEYTDRGKSAIVIPPAAASAIVKAVKSVTAKWAKQRKTEERQASAAQNRRERLIRSRRVTIKDAAWALMENAYMKASANGTLPANARQIMYTARSTIQEQTGKQLDDQYFCQTLLPDYINETGVDWDVVFDDRGHFSEPHTERTIGLGTLAVRKYLVAIGEPSWIPPEVSGGSLSTSGPSSRYGAILFTEKEGFDPLFQHVQLADRFDISKMSTKGLSVTAARALVDEVCAMGVPLLVLHDFDKAGFSIVGTFKRETRRYQFKNQIKVIDLGLRLADVRRLGLDASAEGVFDRGERAARARNLRKNGATPEEVEFLLDRRVELNALTSDQMVAFIERKLAEHGVAKVIPNRDMLAETYRNGVKARRIERSIKERLAKQNANESSIEIPDDLEGKVIKHLRKHPAASWDEAVAKIARGSQR